MTGSIRRSIRGAALGLGVIAVLAVAGCGGGGSSGGGTSVGTSSEPTSGGVLHFALESTPNSLDPSQIVERSAGIVVDQFSEGLFEVGEGGKAEPELAAGATTSADGLTLTITLRPGVTFSTGKPMTSKDVLFTIEQARKSPFNGSLYESIATASAPSPSKVVLKLKFPAPGLTAALANYSAYIVPADYAGMSEKEFAQKPIGTGPYEVTSGQRGNEIKLQPNPHFWGKTKPHFDELVFTVAADENSRLQQILGGSSDMTAATPIGAKTGLPSGSPVRVEETPQRVVNYLLLNQNFPLFEDPRVRQAVNLALDREGIIKTATDEKGQLGASFMAPTQLYGIDSKPPARDVAKAKQLIAAALQGGAGAPFTIRYYDFDAYSALATQIIQQDLEEIGLTVKLQPLDEAALNELLETGEYEAVVGLYNTTLADPFGLSSFYLSFFAPGSGQNVPALTKVADEAAREMNQEKRAALYAELQEEMIEEEGLLVLNYQPEVYPVTEKVSGIEFDSVGNMFLRNAGFSN